MSDSDPDFLAGYRPPPGGLSVRAFGHIDPAHAFIRRISLKYVAHVALLNDLALHGDGEDLVELEDMSEEYRQWRTWWTEQMMQTIRSALGEVLSVSEVDSDGFIYFDPTRLGLVKQVDHLRSFHGRLQYLVDEIRSLHGAYGELYDHEVEEVMAVVDEVDGLDLAVDAQKTRALELHPRLEIYYFWAQPGARYMRGDEDSVEKLLEYVKKQRQEIDEEEARQRSAREALLAEQYEGDTQGLADAVVEADSKRAEIQKQIQHHQAQLEILAKEAAAIGAKRTDLVMAFPDNVDIDRELYDAQARAV